MCGGGGRGGGGGAGTLGVFEPKENVLLAAARSENEKGPSDAGRSWAGASVDEGSVEEELYLAEDALSYGRPVDVELLVPALTLDSSQYGL